MGDPQFEFRQEKKYNSSPKRPNPSGTHPASYSKCTGGVSSVVKKSGREVGLSFPFHIRKRICASAPTIHVCLGDVTGAT